MCKNVPILQAFSDFFFLLLHDLLANLIKSQISVSVNLEKKLVLFFVLFTSYLLWY